MLKIFRPDRMFGVLNSNPSGLAFTNVGGNKIGVTVGKDFIWGEKCSLWTEIDLPTRSRGPAEAGGKGCGVWCLRIHPCIVLTFRSISMFFILKRYWMQTVTNEPNSFKMNNIAPYIWLQNYWYECNRREKTRVFIVFPLLFT